MYDVSESVIDLFNNDAFNFVMIPLYCVSLVSIILLETNTTKLNISFLMAGTHASSDINC